MTILADIAKLLLDDHHGRHLAGGDKGILRAIAAKPLAELRHDDFQTALKIVRQVLAAEYQTAMDAAREDAAFECRAWDRAAGSTLAELQHELARLPAAPAPSVSASGHRSTRRATQSEAAASSFGARRLLERAIEIKNGGDHA